MCGEGGGGLGVVRVGVVWCGVSGEGGGGLGVVCVGVGWCGGWLGGKEKVDETWLKMCRVLYGVMCNGDSYYLRRVPSVMCLVKDV